MYAKVMYPRVRIAQYMYSLTEAVAPPTNNNGPPCAVVQVNGGPIGPRTSISSSHSTTLYVNAVARQWKLLIALLPWGVPMLLVDLKLGVAFRNHSLQFIDRDQQLLATTSGR